MFKREHVTDALRFWEIARVPYNLVLAGVTAWAAFQQMQLCGGLDQCQTRIFGAHIVMPLFFWAVLANVAYCSAYLPDLLAQNSDFRAHRAIWRSAIWTVGTSFAAVVAWTCASVLFDAWS